jgi:hypothetical protein
VKRIRANAAILLTHNESLTKGILASYNMKRVEIKNFILSSGAQSLTIDNAALGNLPKCLLLTMLRNTDCIAYMDSNPYDFRHVDLNFFLAFCQRQTVPQLRLFGGHVKREDYRHEIQNPV